MCIGNKKGTLGIAHETSLDLETETETKYRAILRLETETGTLEMPEMRPRRESRLVSSRSEIWSRLRVSPTPGLYTLNDGGLKIENSLREVGCLQYIIFALSP